MKDKSGCKVLLLTPPKGLRKAAVDKPWISTQPLGLAYVGAAVRDAGFAVEILDAYSLGVSAEDIREKIKTYQPDVVGISSLTPQWPDAVSLADLVKQARPQTLTVAGGPHVTALPEEAAGQGSVDLAVIGEGEATIQDICRTVADKGDLAKIQGLVVGLDGTPLRTAPRERLMELDRLSFPAHDLLPDPAFYNPFPAWGAGGNFSCMISGRGCPYNCCFCDVTSQQGKRYRLRSAENIADELTWLHHQFKVKTFSFRDPSVICSRRRLLELCRLMEERRLDMAWTCSARANEVDDQRLTAMKKAGCRLMQYGIEVGNPEMLQSIKKISRERIAEAVAATRRAGIGAHGYFLFGFMEETLETIQETIDFAKQLKLDSAGFAMMVPFPGTQEYEKYKREGLLLSEDWRDYDVMGKPVYSHKNLSYEELAAAPRRAYRQFYLRPHVMAWHMKKLTSVSVLRNYWRSARLMFN